MGYVELNAALFLVAYARSQLFFSMLLSSSARLHKNAVEAVLRAPMAFFEVNPIGKF